MITRTTTRTVSFRRPFLLTDFSELAPAGAYLVDTQEEQLDSLLSVSWRRVSTTLRMRCRGATEFRSIDPQELDEALLRDVAQDEPAPPVPRPSTKARRARADEFALGLSRNRSL